MRMKVRPWLVFLLAYLLYEWALWIDGITCALLYLQVVAFYYLVSRDYRHLGLVTHWSLASAAAIGVCGLWVWVAFDDRYLADWWQGCAACVALYATSVILLRRLEAAGSKINVYATIACTLTMAMVASGTWENVLGLPVPSVPENWPPMIKIMPYFLNGIIASVLIAAALLYPALLVMSGLHFLVPVLAAAGWSTLELFTKTASAIPGARLITYDLVCLAVLTPLLMRAMVAAMRRRGSSRGI